MSFEKPLEERERALENVFFRKHDEELLAAMRRSREQAAAQEALAKEIGIDDSDALGALLGAGFRSETALALAIVPLVAVGWASGRVEPDERAAILRAASEAGIPSAGPAHDLLIGWLYQPPADGLVGAWSQCMSARCKDASAEERRALHSSVMTRAYAVAKASGGFLGLRSISSGEREMLERLEQSFHL